MGFSKVLAGVAFILVGSALAQNNTVNLFINDDFDGDVGYAASVIGACVDQTTYALRCTSGPAYVGSSTCGPAGVVSKKLHHSINIFTANKRRLRHLSKAQVCTASLS
jgi:hypothetical protein